MYSGRLAYQASFSVTRGESSGSMKKPLRIRCHRSGSGIGTSSMSSKAGGKAAAAEGDSAAGARAGARAARTASVLSLPLHFMQLVLVLQVTFRSYAPPNKASRKEKGRPWRRPGGQGAWWTGRARP